MGGSGTTLKGWYRVALVAFVEGTDVLWRDGAGIGVNRIPRGCLLVWMTTAWNRTCKPVCCLLSGEVASGGGDLMMMCGARTVLESL